MKLALKLKKKKVIILNPKCSFFKYLFTAKARAWFLLRFRVIYFSYEVNDGIYVVLLFQIF